MTTICTIAATVWLEILRRKDVYVLLVLMGTLLAVLVSIDIFGLSGAVRYVKETGLLMAWLFSWILAVIISTRELPSEEKNGTIYPLLAKPITRFELVTGKWLGTWTTTCTATLMFYALVFLIVKARGGHLYAPVLLQGFLLHCAALSMLTSIGTAFSTRLNHDAAATVAFVLSACAFIVVPKVPELMFHETRINSGMLMFIYNALPHFELFDLRRRLVHDFPAVNMKVFFIVLAYAAVWTGFFIFITWASYRGKYFDRSSTRQ